MIGVEFHLCCAVFLAALIVHATASKRLATIPSYLCRERWTNSSFVIVTISMASRNCTRRTTSCGPPSRRPNLHMRGHIKRFLHSQWPWMEASPFTCLAAGVAGCFASIIPSSCRFYLEESPVSTIELRSQSYSATALYMNGRAGRMLRRADVTLTEAWLVSLLTNGPHYRTSDFNGLAPGYRDSAIVRFKWAKPAAIFPASKTQTWTTASSSSRAGRLNERNAVEAAVVVRGGCGGHPITIGAYNRPPSSVLQLCRPSQRIRMRGAGAATGVTRLTPDAAGRKSPRATEAGV